MGSKRVDDIGKAIGQTAKTCHEQPFHRLDIGVQIESCDDGAGVGVGIGRAIAEKFGQYMKVARQLRRIAGAAGPRHDPPLQKLDDFDALAPRGRTRLGVCRMRPKQMIDCGPGG